MELPLEAVSPHGQGDCSPLWETIPRLPYNCPLNWSWQSLCRTHFSSNVHFPWRPSPNLLLGLVTPVFPRKLVGRVPFLTFNLSVLLVARISVGCELARHNVENHSFVSQVALRVWEGGMFGSIFVESLFVLFLFRSQPHIRKHIFSLWKSSFPCIQNRNRCRGDSFVTVYEWSCLHILYPSLEFCSACLVQRPRLP